MVGQFMKSELFCPNFRFLIIFSNLKIRSVFIQTKYSCAIMKSGTVNFYVGSSIS